MRAGTPGYIGPEIFNKTSGYDTKVDIFAIGCIYYLLLMGMHLFTGKNLGKMLVKLS